MRLRVEPVGELPAEQRLRLARAQPAQLEAGEAAGPPGALERGRQALRELTRTDGERREDRRRRPPQQRADHLERARVGPVEVVEAEHERLGRGERLQQSSHGAVGAVTFRGDGVGRLGADRRQHMRQLGPHVVLQPVEPARLDGLHVLVQGVDEDAERHLVLQLGCAAGEHEHPAPVRARLELREQACLADPRLAGQLERPRLAPRETVERAVQRVQLGGAADERRHVRHRRARPRARPRRANRRRACGTGCGRGSRRSWG